MQPVIDWVLANPWFTLFGAVTLIQVTPIKVNPWSWIFKQIRSALVGDIEKTVTEMSHEMESEKVATIRWRVLDFADTERAGRKHSCEQWRHCLDQLSWYSAYCVRKNITNGVMEEASKYLRDAYQEHLRNNDFL